MHSEPRSSGIGDHRPHKWPRHAWARPSCSSACWRDGRSLPEVVHLAVDLLVLDVAAILLPQRCATHGALEAPHVPDEVVDLGRGRRWGVGSARASFMPAPSLPSLICRGTETLKLRRGVWLPYFSSIIQKLEEIERQPSILLLEPGQTETSHTCPKLRDR